MSGERVARGKITIQRMIPLCKSQCSQASDESGHCDALFAYAQKRLDRCISGKGRPACKQCSMHYYQPAKREEVRRIMCWVGPGIFWRHPILTVHHLIDDKRPLSELSEKHQRKK